MYNCGFTFVLTVPNPDTTPPIVHGCPEPLIFTAPLGRTSAILTWTEPTATDYSNMTPVVTQSHQPGDSFTLGVTQVFYVFRDMAGNQATCFFTVTVGNYYLCQIIWLRVSCHSLLFKKYRAVNKCQTS